MSDRFPVKAAGQERETYVLTPLDVGLAELRPVMLWGLFFGLLITLLGFAAPLYMMNVYERVLASRNETTLIVMALIVVFAMLLQSGLDAIRSDFMRRAAVRFDRTIAGPAFDAIQRAIAQRPLDRSLPSLKDVELIRDFIAGGALAGLMDAAWLPLFLIVAYVLHPLFAAIVLIVALAVAGPDTSHRESDGRAGRRGPARPTARLATGQLRLPEP